MAAGGGKLPSFRWEKVQVGGRTGSGPGQRWGHTVSVTNSAGIYVFGGYGRNEQPTAEIFSFDPVKVVWTKPRVKGDLPKPRDSHTCTAIGHRLFVFGGTDGVSALNDVYIFDTVTHVWNKPQIGDVPEGREGHGAAAIGKNLFVFGGCGRSSQTYPPQETYYNDVWCLDTEAVPLRWSKIRVKGTPPSPRDSHGCFAWRNNLVIVGGEDGQNHYFNDVHILDTTTYTWRLLKAKGVTMSSRAGHACTVIGDRMITFGGFTENKRLFNDLHMLDLETGMWSAPRASGTPPSARFTMPFDVVNEHGRIFGYGGCNENLEGMDDLFYLETDLEVPALAKRRKLRDQAKDPKGLKEWPQAALAAHLGAVPFTSVDPLRTGRGGINPQFVATIDDVFHFGFVISTNINGKAMRGMLFAGDDKLRELSESSSLNRLPPNFFEPQQKKRRKRIFKDSVPQPVLSPGVYSPTSQQAGASHTAPEQQVHRPHDVPVKLEAPQHSGMPQPQLYQQHESQATMQSQVPHHSGMPQPQMHQQHEMQVKREPDAFDHSDAPGRDTAGMSSVDNTARMEQPAPVQVNEQNNPAGDASPIMMDSSAHSGEATTPTSEGVDLSAPSAQTGPSSALDSLQMSYSDDPQPDESGSPAESGSPTEGLDASMLQTHHAGVSSNKPEPSMLDPAQHQQQQQQQHVPQMVTSTLPLHTLHMQQPHQQQQAYGDQAAAELQQHMPQMQMHTGMLPLHPLHMQQQQQQQQQQLQQQQLQQQQAVGDQAAAELSQYVPQMHTGMSPFDPHQMQQQQQVGGDQAAGMRQHILQMQAGMLPLDPVQMQQQQQQQQQQAGDQAAAELHQQMQMHTGMYPVDPHQMHQQQAVGNQAAGMPQYMAQMHTGMLPLDPFQMQQQHHHHQHQAMGDEAAAELRQQHEQMQRGSLPGP